MDTEIGFVEKFIRKICTDKNRMISLIFSTLSAISTILYISGTGASGIHFMFVLSMLVASVANIIYATDVDSLIKHKHTIFLLSTWIMFLGSILKVIRVGIAFSLIYTIGYFVYALTFLLIGLYCTKNESSQKIIRVLLIVCAVWSFYEFVSLSSMFISGIIWKIFRLSEAFLSIGYLFILKTVEKEETPIADKVGTYKKQIPSMKICLLILLMVSVVSLGIGFVVDMDKNSTTTVVNTTEKVEKTEKPKKSTVSSVIVPAETKPSQPEEIKIGDKVETDTITFQLNKVELSRRVQPDNPPSYYTYYQAETDHTYIYVNASITNKDKYSLECDEIYSVTADFDSGYTYNGFNIADDDDGDFTYANITSVEPLETLGVHCLIDCPVVVEEENKPLFITITLNNGSKYKFTIK